MFLIKAKLLKGVLKSHDPKEWKKGASKKGAGISLGAGGKSRALTKKGRFGLKKGFGTLVRNIRKYKALELRKIEEERKKNALDLYLQGSLTSEGGGAGGTTIINNNISSDGAPPQDNGASQPKKAAAEEELSRIDISNVSSAEIIPRSGEEDEIRGVSLEYPLTPSAPKKGEVVFSWVGVSWNGEANSLIYKVNEPPLDKNDRAQLDKIKQIIEEKIDIPFDSMQSESAMGYLKNAISNIIEQFRTKIPAEKKSIYEYYILRDFIGLGRIQAIMNDPNVEDLSCDGVNVPLFVYHRNPLVGSVKTNVMFETKEELDDFVMRLAQKCGKSISVSDPLSEGALPDGSRVQATLGTDIARRGSNFTIRKFTADPLTPIHMLAYHTADEKLLAYLWYVIESCGSILISGPTASGKTSFLNALSLFIKPTLKIVTIEDTPELKLPHTHWVPEVCRQGFGTAGGKTIGEVTMFDLLKGSLRQRPDYIIVGEVRGEETFVLFQQMASGHAGLSTIHADSIEKVIDRLTTPPINLPAMLLETLSLIIFVKHILYKGKYVRRVVEIREINRYNPQRKEIESGRTFKWSPETDSFDVDDKSVLMKKIALNNGISDEQLKSELSTRAKILKWLKDKDIKNYKDVGRIITTYYSNPQYILDMIQNDEADKNAGASKQDTG